MARTKGAKNKPTLSVAERLQKANAELTELQEAVKAKKAEIKELKKEEKSEAQQVIMKLNLILMKINYLLGLTFILL